MFANRYTAFLDACALTGVMKRNLLLTLAEAEFFRVRWSAPVLDETQKAIEEILLKKGDQEAFGRALRARNSMMSAFEDACVNNFGEFLCVCSGLPDPNDAHVLAAALKTQASVIVTDNLKHFPASILTPLNLDVRSADAFIADTIALDHGRAVPAIRRMRERFNRPTMKGEGLLIAMESVGLTETVDVLKPHSESL